MNQFQVLEQKSNFFKSITEERLAYSQPEGNPSAFLVIENLYVEFEAQNHIKTSFIVKDHEVKIFNVEEIAS